MDCGWGVDRRGEGGKVCAQLYWGRLETDEVQDTKGRHAAEGPGLYSSVLADAANRPPVCVACGASGVSRSRYQSAAISTGTANNQQHVHQISGPYQFPGKRWSESQAFGNHLSNLLNI